MGLQAQWTEAVRDARSSFMEPVRLLREASKEYLAKHPSESRGECHEDRAQSGRILCLEFGTAKFSAKR